MEAILKNFDAKDWLCKQTNEDFNLSSHSGNPIRTDTQNTDAILNKLSTPVQASVQKYSHYNTISSPSNKVSMRSMTNSYNNSSTLLRNTTEHTSLKSHSLKHSLNGDELNQELNYVILPVGASLKSTQNYPKMNKPDDNSSVMCNYSKATRCSLPKCKPHNCQEEHEIGSSSQHINDIQSFHKQTQPSDATTAEQGEIDPYLKLAVNNNTVSAPSIPMTKYSARSIQNQQTLTTNFPHCPLPTDIPLNPTSNHQTSSLSLHHVPNNPKSKMMYLETQNYPIQSNESSNISRGQEESATCGEN